MRLFVAIELPANLRQVLSRWQEVLRQSIRQKISWTARDNLHLTLKFIGEMDEQRVDAIRLALARIKSAPIPLSITRMTRTSGPSAATVNFSVPLLVNLFALLRRLKRI